MKKSGWFKKRGKIQNFIKKLYKLVLKDIASEFRSSIVKGVVGSLIGLFGMLFNTNQLSLNEPKVFNEGYDTEPEVKGEYTCYLICENFEDLQDWEGTNLFNTSSINPLIIHAPVTDYLSGWVMDHSELVGSSFVSSFTFRPLGYVPNVVFRWGSVFEYIIGDGNNGRISVKNQGKYLAPVGYKSKHFSISPIQIGTDVNLRIWLTPNDGTNTITLHSVVVYFSATGSKETIDVPNFTLTTQSEPNFVYAKIGIGLIDPSRTNDISAQLINLEVK